MTRICTDNTFLSAFIRAIRGESLWRTWNRNLHLDQSMLNMRHVLHSSLLVAAVGVILASIGLNAQEPAASAAGTPAEAAAPAGAEQASVRRALIVCGLVGDADHRKLFAE